MTAKTTEPAAQSAFAAAMSATPRRGTTGRVATNQTAAAKSTRKAPIGRVSSGATPSRSSSGFASAK